jgi:glycerol transport system substrate-binding protein
MARPNRSDRPDGQRRQKLTSPTLDIKDFIGISFTTAPDGKIYQLPDQQFANLYWFRARLVRACGLEGQVQGQVRLRIGRAGELVGL